MSNQKNNPFAGEILTPEIARKAIYELGKVNRIPPGVGIFDAPVRCFRINQEWWALVGGMVHLLADVAAWKDAQDESYPPILEILKFMQGVECADGSEPMIRQKPTDDCVMQQSLDGGETWTDVFDFSLCLNPKITTITTQLQVIEQQNIVNSGYSPTTTTTTGDNGTYTDTELSEMSVEADVCDSAGKDAIYGAVSRLVEFINDKNLDFLQNVAQGANAAEQLARLISATPVVGFAPVDEAIQYAGFLVDELNGEYLATVTVELLQEVKCELFCMAVNSGCVFSLGDVYNFFASRTSPTFSNVSNTLANLMQFALTGTFTGDDYFYFMCYFQMSIAGAKQRFLDIQAATAYEQQMAAGFNSPDNDWSIFCTDCPVQWRVIEFDFKQNDGGWRHDPRLASTSTMSHIPGIGWQGGGTDPKFGSIVYDAETSWRVRAIGWLGRALDNSALDPVQRNWWFRPTRDSTVGQGNVSLSAGTTYPSCREALNATGYQQYAISQNAANGKTIVIEKAIIIFYPEAAAPGAIITEDPTTCNRT